MIPSLHLVTDDGILAREDFLSLARRALEVLGKGGALHLRGPGSPGGLIFSLARELREAARDTGTLLLVNDRVDVALAAGLPGAHLGRRSLPPPVVRELLGPGAVLGLSVHGEAEARREGVGEVDFLVAGTIFPSTSHPGREGAGVGRIMEVRRAAPLPVLAIGGITPSRVQAVLEAGAAGVAVRSGVWEAGDLQGSIRGYQEALAGKLDRGGET